MKVQPVDPCLGYYIPLVKDGQPSTDNLSLSHTSHVNTAIQNENEQAIQESEQRQSSRPPTSSSLDLANAEWSSFVPAVRPPESPCIYTAPRHEEALSVEEFLKRSSRQTYGRKRRANRQKKGPQTRPLSGQEDDSHHAIQTVRDGEEDVVQLRSQRVIRKIVQSDHSSSETEMHTSSISFDLPTPLSEKKKQRARQKKKSLKERIYEAAVATYCDPDPAFVNPEIQDDGSVPLPLRFVPGSEPTRPGKVAKTKKQNWTLIDPRKSVAIRTTTFSSRIRPPNLVFNNTSPLKGEKPVDTYKLTRLGAPFLKPMDRRQSLGKKNSYEYEKLTSVGLAPSPTTIACPPLTFVLILEAEDNYTSLNFGRG